MSTGSLLGLECEAITCRFGSVLALDGTSLSIPFSSVTAIVGSNGAGKTTLLNAISGFVRLDGGSVRYCGIDISRKPAWERARLGLGRTFQGARPFDRLSSVENVMVAIPDQKAQDPVTCLFKRREIALQDVRTRVRALQLLEWVGIVGEDLDRRASALSFGRQKLLGIARAIAAEPRVLMLDEPAAGLHVESKAKVLQLLRDVACSGVAVLIVEHDQIFVREIADQVCFLDAGQLKRSGTPQEVLDDSAVRSVLLGL